MKSELTRISEAADLLRLWYQGSPNFIVAKQFLAAADLLDSIAEECYEAGDYTWRSAVRFADTIVPEE